MKIPFNLGAFLDGAVGPLAKQVFSALGFGIISFSAVLLAFNYFVDLAQTHYQGLPSFVFNLMGLAGFGDAFGMIAGAAGFRIGYQTTSRIGVLSK
ncbi:MAG: DUF2523 domain-containing protein [Nitrosomonas sp.]|nr:DUF2523 domain-containing protein [Nitrosomonas sp.]MCW5608984.1 DUF2523 domain-containing protein [Nitrosomonas sp.]